MTHHEILGQISKLRHSISTSATCTAFRTRHEASLQQLAGLRQRQIKPESQTACNNGNNNPLTRLQPWLRWGMRRLRATAVCVSLTSMTNWCALDTSDRPFVWLYCSEMSCPNVYPAPLGEIPQPYRSSGSDHRRSHIGPSWGTLFNDKQQQGGHARAQIRSCSAPEQNEKFNNVEFSIDLAKSALVFCFCSVAHPARSTSTCSSFIRTRNDSRVDLSIIKPTSRLTTGCILQMLPQRKYQCAVVE